MSRLLPGSPCSLRIEAAGATHAGDRRDRWAMLGEFSLFMVADGAAAEMALSLVGDFVRDPEATWPPDAAGPREGPRARLVAGVKHANQRIHRAGLEQADGRRMVASFAGMLAEGDALCVAHVGNCRAYRLRDQRLAQLTEDHSVLNDLLWRGMPVDMAEAVSTRNELTRALGRAERVDVPARMEEARRGDVVLLSTVGLHEVVPRSELAGVLAELGELEEGVDRMIARASKDGEVGDVRVVLLRWVEAGA